MVGIEAEYLSGQYFELPIIEAAMAAQEEARAHACTSMEGACDHESHCLHWRAAVAAQQQQQQQLGQGLPLAGMTAAAPGQLHHAEQTVPAAAVV